MSDQLLTSVDLRWRTRFGDGSRVLSWSPGSRPLAVGADGTTMIDEPGQVTAPTAPDPVDAAWLGEQRVLVVDTVAGAVFAGSGSTEMRPVEGARCVGFAAGRAAVAGSGVVAVFDSPTDTESPRLVPTGIGHSHALQPTGGALWAVGGESGLVLVDAAYGSVDSCLELDGVRHIAWAPEAERLAVTDLAGAVYLVELHSPEDAIELEGQPEPASHLALAPDGDLLVTASDHELAWWWIDDAGRPVDDPAWGIRHQSPVTALAMSNERLVASGDTDGMVRFWSPRLSDYPVASLELDSEVVQLRWAPCGRKLAVGAMPGEVALFDITPGALA